jgi:hypothetical protein
VEIEDKGHIGSIDRRARLACLRASFGHLDEIEHVFVI